MVPLRYHGLITRVKKPLGGLSWQQSILPTWWAVACEQTRFARLHVTARRTCIDCLPFEPPTSTFLSLRSELSYEKYQGRAIASKLQERLSYSRAIEQTCLRVRTQNLSIRKAQKLRFSLRNLPQLASTLQEHECRGRDLQTKRFYLIRAVKQQNCETHYERKIVICF